MIVYITSFTILLSYYFFFFIRLFNYKKKQISFSEPISVIICAKNEKDNLSKNLPRILSQKYINYEVIVVNDQSTDDTSFLLEDFERKYQNLVVVTIADHVNHKIGKKFALTLGIKSAKHEYLLLTDADCCPASENWIKKMVENYSHSDIILGYGAYNKKPGVLNRFIRFDTFNVAQQYFSYALSGFPYMGVGRNLAYKKSLFFDNKGFASHMHIASGDDDLFIQEVARKDNISIEIDSNAHTHSEVIDTWKQWIYQKRRHITTSSIYLPKFKLLLSIYSFTQFLFWISLFLLFIFDTSIYLIISFLIIKLFVTYLINYRSMKKLNVLDLYWLHPLYEICYLLIQVNFVLLNLFSKPREWNK